MTTLPQVCRSRNLRHDCKLLFTPVIKSNNIGKNFRIDFATIRASLSCSAAPISVVTRYGADTTEHHERVRASTYEKRESARELTSPRTVASNTSSERGTLARTLVSRVARVREERVTEFISTSPTGTRQEREGGREREGERERERDVCVYSLQAKKLKYIDF